MFVFGILIETRVFGELVPFVVCTTTLILEQLLLVRLAAPEITPSMREAINVVETDPTPVLVTAA
jgi:hypothetical protein